MAGALKTLFQSLQASSFLSGVTLKFGEEYKIAQEGSLPYICMVPIGGPIDNNPGYSGGLDPAVELLWGIHEQVDFYLWHADTSPTADAIDHADAVEGLRQLLLSALRDQQAQYTDAVNVSYGLAWTPSREAWALMGDSAIRYGRCLVVTCTPEISVAMALPPEATVDTVTINEPL